MKRQHWQWFLLRPVVSIHGTKVAPYPCIDVNRPQSNGIILFCHPHSVLQYFAIFCSAMKEKLQRKSNGLSIFGDRSNLHPSFLADDVFIMKSDSGSNYNYYFAY